MFMHFYMLNSIMQQFAEVHKMKKINDEHIAKICSVLFPNKDVSEMFVKELSLYIHRKMSVTHCAALFQRGTNSLLKNSFRDFLENSSMPELVDPNSEAEVIIDSNNNIYFWDDYMHGPKQQL